MNDSFEAFTKLHTAMSPHLFIVIRNIRLYLGKEAVPHRENAKEMPLLSILILENYQQLVNNISKLMSVLEG